MIRRCLQSLCAALLTSLALLAMPAHAQSVDGTLDKVETFLGYTDKAAPGQLPVSQAEFKQYRVVFKNCLSSQDADGTVLCMDAFLDTPAGKEVAQEMPSWVPMVLDIYMDIRNDDFWGLARDVGMLAACIGAQVITGGVDVCGVIQALVDMAKEAYAKAMIAYEFLFDLGSTVVKAAEEVYCWFSDCSKDGPPPEAVAWANFWHPRIPTGALLMKNSGDLAQLDAMSFNFINSSDGLILKTQNPKVYNALASTRGQFIEAVKLQWDAQILQQVIPSLAKVRQAWLLPDKAQQQVKSGLKAAQPNSGVISEPWQMAAWRKQAGTNVGYFCRMAMADAHALHVSRWVKDGRAAKLGSSEKGATPEEICEPHLQMAQPLFDNSHRLATREMLLAHGCTAQGNTFACDSVPMDSTCDFAVDYFKSGFTCQVDWRKAVAKLMGQVSGCKITSGDQIYQCSTWPGQDQCEVNFAKVNQIAGSHCKLDRAAADADLAKMQIATLSTPSNACIWQSGQQSGQISGQIVCPRDVQHLHCQALQSKPFHPALQVHALGCKLQRTPSYEAAVQQAQALRTAMTGSSIGASAQARSNTPAMPSQQMVQHSASGGTIKWLPHPDPLLFIADVSTMTQQGLATIDQLAKSKQPGFAGFAACAGSGVNAMLSDKDGVDTATLCTQGQIADGQKQQEELGKKLGSMQATLSPVQVAPGGGGPVQGGSQINLPSGIQMPSGCLPAGGIAAGGLGTALPALPGMIGNAPAQQVMSAPMPGAPGGAGGAPGAVNTSGSAATPARVAAPPTAAAAAPSATAVASSTPQAAARSISPDAATLRSLIAAGCRQANAAVPGAITCSSDAAMAQCVTAQRETKVSSCTLQR
jgi:hypothetical protein